MKVKSFRFFLFFKVLFLIFISVQRTLFSAPSAESLLQKMELRRGSWIFLDASVRLNFKTFSNQRGVCEGALLYNRLDEKLFLDCRGQNSESLFIFRTEDRNFELYLPSHGKIYKGNIFVLEDSAEIESHLRPLDLYRALKPAVFFENDVTSIKEMDGRASIVLQSARGVRRKIELSREGDVIREAYEGEGGGISLVIERSEFEAIQSGPAQNVFPRKILIKSSKDANVRETLLDFQIISFPASLSDDLFKIHAAENIPVEEIS